MRWRSSRRASSALPYNIITGFDNNGDTVINDRPDGVARNTARGAATWNLNARLGQDVRVRAAAAGGPHGHAAGRSDSRCAADLVDRRRWSEDVRARRCRNAGRYKMEFYVAGATTCSTA